MAAGLSQVVVIRVSVTAALRTHVSTLPVTVRVVDHDLARHPPPVESAIYFACLEALQNALRHSAADTITVELSTIGDSVRFAVADDGRGFDITATGGTGLVNIEDRLGALGGRLSVDSAPGRGTRVTGIVPVGGGHSE